jgi:hypothetical protein
VDESGNIYIAGTGNNLVRKVTVSTDPISTVAEGLSMPFAVAVDRSDNTYIADTGNFRIRKVTAFPSALAGTGNASYFGDVGTAVRATLNSPDGVWVDTFGGRCASYVACSRFNLSTP